MIGDHYTPLLMVVRLSQTLRLDMQIERELMGVVGGLEKCHYFTFGCPVMVLTDHKPLIAISKKIPLKCTTQTPAFIVKTTLL